MKDRLLADPAFLAKLAIETGMGVVTTVIAEHERRGGKFLAELDLVIANTIMALITDAMLLWIPAPRANLSTPAVAVLEQQQGMWVWWRSWCSFWAACPANAFQVSQCVLRLLHNSS